MNKKRLLISAILLAFLLGAYLFMVLRDTQSSLSVESTDGYVGAMKIVSRTPLMVQLDCGVVFKLDTGSDISTLTEKDFATLDSLGLVKGKTLFMNGGRDGAGIIRLKGHAHKVDLPLGKGIKNVTFVHGETPFSVIGTDVLSKFILEYLDDRNLLVLHTERPEGYEDIVGLTVSRMPHKTIWPGSRYYLPLSVDGHGNDYFIDTGLQHAAIKLPTRDMVLVNKDFKPVTFRSMLVVTEAWVDSTARIECASRSGSHEVYYCDNREEPYSINPINLFSQDVLIDFKDGVLCLHPYVDYASTTRHCK